MKIKEIILEGFKSYSERTTITELDPQFNAITGLNGSGKSNILEAICFVLGLQSWTLARVQTIRELIYKNGQAGIKQASVTVIFCNKDKSTSPFGFEEFDEIKVMRLIKYDQSVYFLNSKKVPNNRIRAIFKSIGLNIDNYNTFFVQQGRIMSIVNFHPKELMGFIEETAGVSYYNQVKENCIHTLEKKDEKLKRINEVFDGEMREDLERYEKDVEHMRAFKRNEAELKKVVSQQRFYERKLAKDEMAKLENECEELREKKNYLNTMIEDYKIKLKDIEREIDKRPPNTDERLLALEKETRESKEDLDKHDRKLHSNKEGYRKMEEELARLEMKLLQTKNNRENLIESTRNLEWQTEQQKGEVQKLKLELEKLQFVNGQNSGNVGDFLKKNLEELRSNMHSQSLQLQGIKRQIGNEEGNLENLASLKTTAEERHNMMTKKIEEKNIERNLASKKLEGLTKNFVDPSHLKNKLEELKAKVSDLNQKRRQITRDSNQFEIPYSNNRHFLGPNMVYGRVHELFLPKEKNFLVSLEVVAGSKLFSIVVENEDVAQKIIEKKIIQGRNDYIPNNKILPKTLNPETWAQAEAIARRMNEQIWNPMSLIEFQPHLQRTFEYVFGDKIICSSLEVAREIAYSPIKRVCVTKDGDVVNPSGLLEGGYTPEAHRFLPKSLEYREISTELEKIHKQHDEIDSEYSKAKESSESINRLKAELDEMKRVIEETHRRANECKVNEANIQYDNIRKKLGDLRLEEEAKNKIIETYRKKIHDLEHDMSKKGNNEQELLDGQIKSRKLELEELEKVFKACTRKFEINKVDIENSNNEEQEIKNEIVESKNNLEKAKAKLEELDRLIENLQEKFKTRQERLQEMNKAKMKDERIYTDLAHQKNEYEAELIRLHKDYEQVSLSLNKTLKMITDFRHKLHDRSQRFSQEVDEEMNLDLDQLLNMISTLDVRKQELQKEQEVLAKRFDKDCDTNYNKIREKFQNVNNMKDQVMDNRNVLVTNITGLDEKKKSAVENCFNEVNKNLGLIFSSLLPGAYAEMKMVELIDKRTKTAYLGIEIRISFNGKWKDSLTELSGGQRSLLALSFLLAMLRYRPAPFYILDEVDAALDLSHTENLGALISKHFPQSQFLVISLKEELFNNANVLFKTSVHEGRSRIERFNIKGPRSTGMVRG
jgi:structural maintenance of chromosome 2